MKIPPHWRETPSGPVFVPRQEVSYGFSFDLWLALVLAFAGVFLIVGFLIK